MLRLDPADRRRVVTATAITIIALPSLWLMSRNEGSGAPNVATAGVAVGDAAPADPAPAATTEASEPAPAVPDTPPERIDPMGSPGAAYLEGPAAAPEPGVIAIAIPGDDGELRAGRATYRSDVPGVGVCLVPVSTGAAELTITNVDNGRSVTCRPSVTPLQDGSDVVLHTQAFARIADLTDAPVPVEISW